MHGDDAAAIGVVDPLGGERIASVAGIAVKAGATVQVIDRNPDKAAASAEGVTGVKFGEAITGDIVVLALPFPAYADAFATYGDQLAGKTVVDVSNPIDFGTFDLALPEGFKSAAEYVAAKLPNSAVVKAFNTTFATTLAIGVNDGEPTVVSWPRMMMPPRTASRRSSRPPGSRPWTRAP